LSNLATSSAHILKATFGVVPSFFTLVQPTAVPINLYTGYWGSMFATILPLLQLVINNLSNTPLADEFFVNKIIHKRHDAACGQLAVKEKGSF
jgi:hypothetical protein